MGAGFLTYLTWQLASALVLPREHSGLTSSAAGSLSGLAHTASNPLFPDSLFPELGPPPPPSPPHSLAAPLVLDSPGLGTHNTSDCEVLEAAASSIQESVWAGRTRGYRPPTVEDAEDEEDYLDSGGDAGAPELEVHNSELWERLGAEERAEAEYEAISVWDELAEFFIREGMINGEWGHISPHGYCLTRGLRWCAHRGGYEVFTAVRTQGRYAHARGDFCKASPRFPRLQYIHLEGHPGPCCSSVRLSACTL